jgi:hypothetical protein
MNTVYRHSSHQPALREGCKEMMRRLHGAHAITFTFNERYKLNGAEKCLKHWYERTMKRVFGRNWAEVPAPESMQLVLLPENLMGHVHFHGQLRVAPDKEPLLRHVAERIWKSLAPKGEVCIRPIYHLEGWLDYATKYQPGWSEVIQLPDWLK